VVVWPREEALMAHDAEDKSRDGWMEVVIAIVLSAGGLMTSWASYQAALWDGEQAAHYSRANALRVMATRVRLESDARHAVEINLFNGWLEAKAKEDERLAGFYQVRFPADMLPAFQAWVELKPLKNPNAPLSPFAMPGYRPEGLAQSQRLETQADATYATGQNANTVSDLFTQGAVFLATAMFFGGIGQVFKVRPVRLVLLAVAVVTCVIGLARIITLPALQPG
jgi:hypothetical protein